jgi:hypothetical protein
MNFVKSAVFLTLIGLMSLGAMTELQAASSLGAIGSQEQQAKEQELSAVYFRVGPRPRHYYRAPGYYYRTHPHYHYYPYPYYYRAPGIYFRIGG